MENDKPVQPSDKALILIVDDRPKNLQVLVNILRKEKYKVAVATEGKQALSLVEEHHPDLILLDIMLPELDGYEICKILKESPETREIPIVFLTGKTETQDVVKGFQSGAVDYVTKPFNSIELLSRVNTHLEVQRSRDTILQINTQLRDEVEERKKITEELKRKNAILDKMAVTDSLTGLFNHRFIIERLGQEIAEAKRYDFNLSVIMFDIDYFKTVNDNYGHQMGDKVLFEISETIKDQLRKVDIVGRYGGEEFLVICPHTDLEGILITAERIRKKIGTLTFGEENMNVTISGGVGTLKDEDVSELIRRTDELLYQAKENGRNRIEHALEDQEKK